MYRRDTVRLYDCGLFQRHIKPDEAEAMLERGEVVRYYEERPKGPHHVRDVATRRSFRLPIDDVKPPDGDRVCTKENVAGRNGGNQ
jgi:hypothetical protein